MPDNLWRKNLYIITIAEFFAIVGFSLYLPFLPLYMQKLGGFDSEKAALWAGIATGGGGLAMFISAPLWGLVADRLGRKPMLLRAQIGGTIIAALFAIAPNVYFLVALRSLQGLFTGTIAAASALIASMTPKGKLPYSMGIFMAAVLGGQTIGPLVGGFLADNFGFTTTFFITSSLLLIGGLIVLFFVKENFQRPLAESRTSLGAMVRLASSREIFPLLLVLAALSIGPQMASPVLPLIFGTLNSAGSAASSSGSAYALVGLIGATSSLVFGRLHGRIAIGTMLAFCCIGTGLLYLPPIWASSAIQLVIFFGITGLLVGGIVTSSNSLVSLTVPVSRQGVAYGLSQSASSLGIGVGPLIGGGLAPLIGLRPVFGVAAGVFVLVGFLAKRLVPNRPVRSSDSPYSA